MKSALFFIEIEKQTTSICLLSKPTRLKIILIHWRKNLDLNQYPLTLENLHLNNLK